MSALLSRNRDRLVRDASFIVAGAILLLAGLATPSHAAIISWNAGDGSWYDVGNWSPNVIPDGDDVVRIGNLPGVEDSTVLLGGQLTQGYDELEITDGMTLDLNGTELVSFGVMSISGENSQLIARPQALGPNAFDLQGVLDIGVGGRLQLMDDVRVRVFDGSASSGLISGRGEIEIGSPAPFRNDGVIDPEGNGGIVMTQVGMVPIDLDGLAGNGQLLLNVPFDQLEINASGLSDSFSGSVFMVPGALLTMNIAEGWQIGGGGSINVAGSDNPAAASQITGSELTLGGMMNVGGAQGQLRVLAPAMIMPAAIVNVGEDGDRLEFEGTTTVLGGQFTLGNDGQLDFEGETTLEGGVFNTHSALVFDGSVSFNGPTVWDGNVTINGAARQNGVATVAGNTIIDADTLDMDGAFGPTTWNVHSNAIINAASIDTTFGNIYDGTLNVGAGFFGQLTINIDSLAPQWTMAGEMNLNGVAAAAFFLNRVGGSHLRISGDVNVTHRVRITSDATFGDDSVTSFADAAAALQMTGRTLVASDAAFEGEGTLDNGAAGEMTLASGATLDQVGLVNRGLLQVGNSPGIAAVDRFANMASGAWSVEIGGHVAGAEHDLLIASGGGAVLDGTIEVDLIDAGGGLFLPQIGDAFTVLTAVGGVSGMFLNDPISSAAGMQFHWSVLYHPNDVTLVLADVTVPEPATLGLVAVGAIASALGRRLRSEG